MRVSLISETFATLFPMSTSSNNLCLDYSKDPFVNNFFNPAFPWDTKLGLCMEHNFKLEEQIGKGHYGTVHRALHIPTGTMVAIKAMKFSSNDVSDVRREECLQRVSDHPAIRRHFCTYAGHNTMTMNLVLEYIEGMTLEKYLEENEEKIPVGIIKDWTIKLSGAIHSLHQNAITFCDFKAANLIVTNGMDIKIIDFGLARASRSEPPNNVPVGAAMSWPPEHFPLEPTKCYSDPSVDWWALGTVLYMAFTRRYPYDDTLLAGFKKDRFKYFSEFGKLVGAGIEVPNILATEHPLTTDLIQRLTSVDPSSRIGLSEETALDEILNHPWITLQIS